MTDGNGLAEALLGLVGFRVLEVTEGPAELVIVIESDVQVVGCRRCGVRAQAQDRMRIDIRDLTCFGRPARLVWIKRRWRCVEVDCDARTDRTLRARRRSGRADPAGRRRGVSPGG